MSGNNQAVRRPLGACFFGTTQGLKIHGVGCLTAQTGGLLRAIDFGQHSIQRGEIAWFSLPIECQGEAGWIVGRVGFASDFQKRAGNLGVALAISKAGLDSTGYAGPVNTVEKLYDWFVANCVGSEEGSIDFTKAMEVIGRIGIESGSPGKIGNEELARLGLTRNWQSYIDIAQLLEILPMQFDFGDIGSRGFILRTVDGIRVEHTITDDFLSSWRADLLGPKERQKLVDTLDRTFKAYRAQEEQAKARAIEAEGLTTRLRHVDVTVKTLEGEREAARRAINEAETTSARLAKQMETVQQAAATAAAERARIERELKQEREARADYEEQLRQQREYVAATQVRAEKLEEMIAGAQEEGAKAARGRISQLERDSQTAQVALRDANAKLNKLYEGSKQQNAVLLAKEQELAKVHRQLDDLLHESAGEAPPPKPQRKPQVLNQRTAGTPALIVVPLMTIALLSGVGVGWKWAPDIEQSLSGKSAQIVKGKSNNSGGGNRDQELRQALAETRTAYQSLERTLSHARVELDRSEAGRKESVGQLRSAQQENQALRIEIERQRKDIDHNSRSEGGQVVALRGEIQKLHAEIDRREIENGRLRTDLASALTSGAATGTGIRAQVSPNSGEPPHSACQRRLDEVMSSEAIRFDDSSSTINNAIAGTLAKIIVAMRNCDGIRIEIASHSDRERSEVMAKKRSQERADEIRNFLTSNGKFPENLLSANGYGQSIPLIQQAPGDIRNRRVEFKAFPY